MITAAEHRETHPAIRLACGCDTWGAPTPPRENDGRYTILLPGRPAPIKPSWLLATIDKGWCWNGHGWQEVA